MILKKFEDCIFVHGSKNSLIADLGRSYFLHVDKEVLIDIESKLNLRYESENNFINFLIESNILFLTSEESSSSFIPLSKYWIEPSLIDNAVVKCAPDLYNKTFDLLEDLLCYNITIIVSEKDLRDLPNFLRFLNKSLHNKIFQNINLYLSEKYHSKMKKIIAQFMNDTPNVQQLFFLKNNKTFEICKSHMPYRQAMASTSDAISTKNKIYFNPTIYFYLDAINNNTTYNKRIFIGKNGELKNNEYDSEIFGNITDLAIDEVKGIVKTRSFQKKWKINKDKVEICKDCEYRYICEDLTSIVKGKGKKWHRSEKCNYDPYLGLWGSSKKVEKFNQKS